MNSVDISIIIPAYNAEKYIRQTIDSIIAQKIDGTYEIRIADDCSNDSTSKIIREYADKYSNTIIVTYNEKNIGCSNNYLQLAMEAKGKYLAFCDADDVWLYSNKLQIQFDFLQTNQEYGLICSKAITGKAIEIDQIQPNTYLQNTSYEGKEIEYISLMESHTDIFNSSIMLRKELFIKMANEYSWFIQNKTFFDSVWAYWFSQNSRIWEIKAPLVFYRTLPNSDCHSSDPAKQYILEKRYFTIKVMSLLLSKLDNVDKLSILTKEYDYLYKNSKWFGEEEVRKSHSYKIGQKIVTILKWFRVHKK